MREPTSEEVTAANVAFHADLAATYDERAELFHPRVLAAYQALFDRHVFSAFAPGRALEALDVGCGTGLLERFLLPRASRVVGYDVSEAMLARARARFPEVDYRVGDAYALPLDRTFDVVCENALLHHLKDWPRALDRLAACVRPDGVLFLGYEPNALAFRVLAPLRSIVRRLLPEARVAEAVGHDHHVEHLAEYHQFFAAGLSPWRIARRLRAAGFSRIEVLFRGEHALAQLLDRTGSPLVARALELAPSTLLRVAGPLTPNFHLVARR